MTETYYIQEMLPVYDLIIKQNYFSHEEHFWQQKEGLAMGAPFSALLSEIFLQFIEENYILNILTNNNILGYYRYVDDILIIYDHISTNINTLLNKFNQIHQKLTYTMELENNQQINFDITISRTNNALEFNIFRKPTYTDTIIPYNSCHPTEHKFTGLRYFISHLNTYQAKPKERDNEKLTTQNIAHNNGFPLYIIDNLMNKQSSHPNNTTTQKEINNKKWATMTFFGKETYYISKIFKHTNLQIAFKTKYNLQYLLNPKNTKKDILKKSGVYQLNCINCGKTYTGQTGQSFEKRYKEHLQSYKYNTQNSIFAQHTIELGHEFREKNDIKFLGRKGKYLDTTKKFYIYQETKRNNQINDKHTVIYNKIFQTILENKQDL
jgi:hypothetical protein